MSNTRVFASRRRRFFAIAIDSILFQGVLWLARLVVPLTVPAQQAMHIAMAVLMVGYYIFLESSVLRGTLGKKFLGIVVETRSGDRLSLVQAAIRSVTYILPMLPLLWIQVSPRFADFTVKMEKARETTDVLGFMQYMQSPEVVEVTSGMTIYFTIFGLSALLFYWLPILFTKERTGLHDIASDTRVFRA